MARPGRTRLLFPRHHTILGGTTMADTPFRAPEPSDTPDHTGPRAASSAGASPRRRNIVRWAVPAVAVLAVGGGAAFAVSAVAGGDAQPDTVIPASAMGYLRLDVDPSVGQKLAAVRFLSRATDVKDVLSGDDFRKSVFEKVQRDEPGLADIDYDRDVAPWLGDRLGIGVLPPSSGEEPVVVVALEVKDEDKARTGIGRLTKDSAVDTDVAFRDGYALMTSKGNLARVTTALDKGALATNASYRGDMEALGETGVLSGWADLRQVAKLADASQPAALKDSTDKLGRAAFALRFDSSYLELAGVGRGAEAVPELASTGPSELGTLPADTAAALSLSGVDRVVDEGWRTYQQTVSSLGASGQDFQDQVAGVEQSLGLKLPADLKTLLGTHLLLAVPSQDFSAVQDVPTMGLRISTDAEKADATLTRVERTLADQGQQLPLEHEAKDGRFLVATSKDYLDDLGKEGALGEQDAFRLAVPDANDAQFAAYVNLDAFEPLTLPEVPAGQRDLVKGLRSIGVSGTATGHGDSTFRLRLVGE